jgi:hypothetical protein
MNRSRDKDRRRYGPPKTFQTKEQERAHPTHGKEVESEPQRQKIQKARSRKKGPVQTHNYTSSGGSTEDLHTVQRSYGHRSTVPVRTEEKVATNHPLPSQNDRFQFCQCQPSSPNLIRHSLRFSISEHSLRSPAP